MNEKIENIRNQFSTKINRTSNNIERICVCAEMYSVIADCSIEKQKATLFKWFIEYAESIWCQESTVDQEEDIHELLERLGMSDKENDDLTDFHDGFEVNDNMLNLTEEKCSTYHLKYKKLIEGIIGMLCVEGMAPVEYYEKLWETIDKLFKSKEEGEKGFCLYAIIWSKLTPYFEIKPGLRMGNDEFRKIRSEIDLQLQKMDFIFCLPNAQRTETASQLLLVMEELDSASNKSVFLGHMIAKLLASKDESIDLD